MTLLYILLSLGVVVRADFVFEFEISRIHINGNCFGMDFSIPCETFVSEFCLRGPNFIGVRNVDRQNCPLGKNTERVFTQLPAQRTIRSSQPWLNNFQLFIGGYDDDPFSAPDFLDNIFINRERGVSPQFSATETIFGIHNRVGVDIRFRVTCVVNYYRSDCTQFCQARNDAGGHYTCNPSDGSIICNPGFEHPQTNCVDVITACSASPCLRGSCTPIGQTEFTCSCPPGYTGPTCAMELDECLNNTVCLNGGNCTDLVADYSCSCVPGFTGKDCEIDINECLTISCVGNSTCVNGINKYECVCNPGYTGVNCTTELDPCDPRPCSTTGQCLTLSPFNYTCQCDPGYTGRQCDVNIDECAEASCPENSDCVDGVGSYSCMCHIGFVGDNCSSMAVLNVAGIGSEPATESFVGGLVGGLMALIILLLLIILVVALMLVLVRRHSMRELNIPADNSYEPDPSNAKFVQSDSMILNNPLYNMDDNPRPEPNDFYASPDFVMSTSPAYEVHDINNPLYGEKSPLHKEGNSVYAELEGPQNGGQKGPLYAELEGPQNGGQKGPLYAELEGPQNGGQRGHVDYPYSYTDLGRDRQQTASNSQVPPPNFTTESKSGGHQYEVMDLCPASNSVVQNNTADVVHQYDTPKPVIAGPPSSLPQPYLESQLSPRSEAENSSKLTKKSIYNSQEDVSVEANIPAEPILPPQNISPAAHEKLDMYSYVTAERSIKDSGQNHLPMYNRLEHNLGPGCIG